MPRRMIDCTRSDFQQMTAMALKESIHASEGRVILAQCNARCVSLIDGATNTEIACGYGADMILLNGYSMDKNKKMLGLLLDINDVDSNSNNIRIKQLKELVNRPIGIYLECPDENSLVSGVKRAVGKDRVANEENLLKALEEGADFVVLGGNPNTGTTIKSIIEATNRAKKVLGDNILIWAGKWEDGTIEKVLGDPIAKYDSKEIVKELIDVGADVICFPAPGSRMGITTDGIRELVELTHTYNGGALAMVFLDGSVEGADEGTIRRIGLMMKETGADIHAIGDAGYLGIPVPENIYALSITIKGRRHTWRRMASNNR